MFDELVLSLKAHINGTAGKPVIDQTTLFYTQRKRGEHYLPPFTIDNHFFCRGKASDIEDTDPENPVEYDHYLVSVNDLSKPEDEHLGDQAKFATLDLAHYDVSTDLLTGGNMPTEIRKRRLRRRICQDLNPHNGEPYREPYEYHEMLYQDIYKMEKKYREEWRQVFEDNGVKLRKDAELEEIPTLEEREQMRVERLEQKERDRAEYAKKRAEEKEEKRLTAILEERGVEVTEQSLEELKEEEAAEKAAEE